MKKQNKKYDKERELRRKTQQEKQLKRLTEDLKRVNEKNKDKGIYSYEAEHIRPELKYKIKKLKAKL